MSGVKGRSGRKSLTDEAKRLRIIEKAWDLIEKSFDDQTITLSQKLECAKAVALKSMPDLIEGEGFESNNLVLVRYALNAGSESKSEALAG